MNLKRWWRGRHYRATRKYQRCVAEGCPIRPNQTATVMRAEGVELSLSTCECHYFAAKFMLEEGNELWRKAVDRATVRAHRSL